MKFDIDFVIAISVYVSVAFCNKHLEWKQVVSCISPTPRGGARLVNTGSVLFYWGGFLECFDQDRCDHIWRTDLYHFDLSKDEWESINATGSNGITPQPRAFFGANYWENGEVVVLFGGIQYNVSLSFFLPFGDIWFYSPNDKQWELVTPTNTGPGIRIAPNVAIYKNDMYVFGGLLPTFQVVNDLWKFDLITKTWTQLILQNAIGSPGPTYLSSFRVDSKSKNIVLYGGNIPPAASGIQTNQTWLYSINNNNWTQIYTPFLGRIHNAAEVWDGTFTTAFGDIENVPNGPQKCVTPEASAGQNPTDEVFQLDLKTFTWVQLFPECSPGPLKRVASTRVNGKMYVVGGYDFQCPPQNKNPGIVFWNRNTYTLKL